MEIEKEITKEIFERHCPAAKSSDRQASVYSRMVPFFKPAYDRLVDEIVGRDYEERMEPFKDYVIAHVCYAAFCEAMSSLDLVLTGTGFGVVSTTDTAPASQTRVQALKDDMQWMALTNLSTIIARLTMVEGWGSTAEAARAISVLYYSPSYVMFYGPTTSDYSVPRIQQWRTAVALRFTPEQKLRQELSDEYYEELLVKLRTYKMSTADRILYNRCMEYESTCIQALARNIKCPEIPHYGIRDYMERNIESFPTYKSSKLYAYLHGEHYENKQTDNIFAFVN